MLKREAMYLDPKWAAIWINFREWIQKLMVLKPRDSLMSSSGNCPFKITGARFHSSEAGEALSNKLHLV
jgi:hypothetical protein